MSSVLTGNSFFLETHAWRVVLDGDATQGCVSSQNNDLVLMSKEAAQGVLVSKFRVESMRMGGGFGSKIFAQAACVCAIAVAAHNWKQTVRVQTELRTDMQAFSPSDQKFNGCGGLDSPCAQQESIEVLRADSQPTLWTLCLEGRQKRFRWEDTRTDRRILVVAPVVAVVRVASCSNRDLFILPGARTITKLIPHQHKLDILRISALELGPRVIVATVPIISVMN